MFASPARRDASRRPIGVPIPQAAFASLPGHWTDRVRRRRLPPPGAEPTLPSQQPPRAVQYNEACPTRVAPGVHREVDGASHKRCSSDIATHLLMSHFEISTDASRLDIAAIHAFLSASYWSPGIPVETVRRAVLNSICVGVYLEARQVAFARAVTDKATFAYLADVYVLEEFRGKGLSIRMVEALLKLPELQGLRRMMLVTRDAHGLYAKFGFTPLESPDRVMELHRPNAYSALPAGPSPEICVHRG